MLDSDDVEGRNKLRRAAQLPLLDVAAETARLARVAETAKFESDFAHHRDRVHREWTGLKGGYFLKLARYADARRTFRTSR